MTPTFIFGSGVPPDWLQSRLMQFVRTDGTVGCEVYTQHKTFVLEKGDVCFLTETGDVYIQKCTKVFENKGKTPQHDFSEKRSG